MQRTDRVIWYHSIYEVGTGVPHATLLILTSALPSSSLNRVVCIMHFLVMSIRSACHLDSRSIVPPDTLQTVTFNIDYWQIFTYQEIWETMLFSPRPRISFHSSLKQLRGTLKLSLHSSFSMPNKHWDTISQFFGKGTVEKLHFGPCGSDTFCANLAPVQG